MVQEQGLMAQKSYQQLTIVEWDLTSKTIVIVESAWRTEPGHFPGLWKEARGLCLVLGKVEVKLQIVVVMAETGLLMERKGQITACSVRHLWFLMLNSWYLIVCFRLEDN